MFCMQAPGKRASVEIFLMATACTGAWMEVRPGKTLGCAIPARLERLSSIPLILTLCSSQPLDIHMAQILSAEFSVPLTEARLGKECCTRTRIRGALTCHSTPEIRTFCLPRSGRHGALPGTCPAVVQEAVSIAPRMEAPLGSSSSNMVFLKDRMEKSEWRLQLILSAFMHSSKPVTRTVVCTVLMMAATRGS